MTSDIRAPIAREFTLHPAVAAAIDRCVAAQTAGILEACREIAGSVADIARTATQVLEQTLRRDAAVAALGGEVAKVAHWTRGHGAAITDLAARLAAVEDRLRSIGGGESG